MNIKNYATFDNPFFRRQTLKRSTVSKSAQIFELTWLTWLIFAFCRQNILPLQIGFLAAVACTIYQALIHSIHEERPGCALYVVTLMFLGITGPTVMSPSLLRSITVIAALIKILIILAQDNPENSDHPDHPATNNYAHQTPSTTNQSPTHPLIYNNFPIFGNFATRFDRFLALVQDLSLPDWPLYRWIAYASCYVSLIYHLCRACRYLG